MSQLQRLTLVTSAAELADFPAHLVGQDARELLASWTALWHPVLLAAAGSLPTIRADYELPDPQILEGELAIVPAPFDHGDAATWREQLRIHPERRLYSLKGIADRGRIIASALAALGRPTDPVDPDLTADFFALGFAYLQVEMLTRLMRCSHLIEPEKLSSTVAMAANAAIEGRVEQARESIAAACDSLTQARNHYYPVDVHFVEVALLAESVWGAPLRAELASSPWLSVLATGEQLERMAAVEPESVNSLRAACTAKPQAACLIGGAYSSGPLSRFSPEALLDDFRRGRAAALRVVGQSPRVFAHFQAGLAPLLPRLLHDFQYQGALLASFDGGLSPRADQCRTTWTGPDGAAVEALVATPLDAGKAETLLGLAEAISRSMDHDHVATILLAGWPGHRSPYLEDLRRLARFGPVLGRFVSLDDYFETTTSSDFGFTARLDDFGKAMSGGETASVAEVAATHDQLLSGLADVAAASLAATRGRVRDTKGTAIGSPAQTIASVLGSAGGNASDVLAVNAWNFDRTILREPDIAIPHVPGFGFSVAERSQAPPPVPLVEGLRLRNEFIEVLLDERTGGIQSVHLHGQRGNLFSQQLVCRGGYCHPDDDRQEEEQAVIDQSEMVVADFNTIESGQEAVVVASGRVMGFDDKPLASYRQTIRLPRHNRLVQIDIELGLIETASNRHFASRIAWRDSAPEIALCAQWLNMPTFRPKFESGLWTRVDTPVPLTLVATPSLLCERIGERMLDAILPQAHSYSYTIAVGEPNPAHAALGLLTGRAESSTTGISFQHAGKGWWLHLAAKNLIVTHLSAPAEEPHTIELRVLETMGRQTRTSLRLWKPIARAHRTSVANDLQEPLPITAGAAELQIAPYEWLGLRLTWSIDQIQPPAP